MSLLEQLITAGVPANLIAEVARLEARVEIAERTIEGRRAKDRERKRNPRNSEEAAESSEVPSLEVSPQTPLPNSNPVSAPLNPPKKGRKSKTLVFQAPEWVPAEPWLAFVAMRKAMRGIPFTDVAAQGVVRELDKLRAEGHCPEKLLLKAVTRGWRQVFPGEDTKGYSGTGRAWTAEERAAYLAKIDGGTGPPGKAAHG